MDDKLASFFSVDRIEYLTCRRFPDRKAVQTNQPYSIAARGGTPYEYRLKRLQEIEAYEAELRLKSPEGLQLLYEQEKEKEALLYQEKADREEQQRFFNHPAATADYVHWSKAAHWTLEEAVALSFGKNPEVVTWKRIQAYTNTSLFASQYAKTRDLVLRAKAMNQLYDPVLPGFYLAWARRLEINAPIELLEQINKRGVLVADWKENFDKLKEQFDILLPDRDKIAEICKRLIKERDEYKKKCDELESNAWEGFDPESDTYPPELDIAMQAWRGTTIRPQINVTAKVQIDGWLEQHYPDRRKLSKEARERIGVICNWEKAGGRRPG